MPLSPRHSPERSLPLPTSPSPFLAAALCLAAGAHAAPSASRVAQIDSIVARYEATMPMSDDVARCVVLDDLSILFHPSTTPETVRETLLRVPEPTIQAYRTTNRWTQTRDGSVGSRVPFTITYSFVADGTAIAPALDGESSGPSNLFAILTPRFGGDFENWKRVFRSAISVWGEYTPITYTEVTDDGAGMPNSAGSSSRGDVRIGMHSIDGPSGVLAYNFFPNNGDMVLDADDAAFFANPEQEYRGLFNTVSHEHGHGLGFLHVGPTNQTKLMEPFVSTLFAGPQEDDIRGATFLYGDFLESNNTFATRAYIGTVPAPSGSTPGSGVLSFSSIEDTSAADFYSFTVPVNGTLTVTANPVGTTYREGAQDTPGTFIDARAMQDLSIELRNSGNATLASADAAPAGSPETISGLSLTAGDYVLLTRSAGGTTGQAQLYEVTFTLAGAGARDRLEFSFESTPEGWTFAGFPPLSAGSGQHVGGSDPGGTLGIRSAGTGSFGFWESPYIEVLEPGQSPQEGNLGILKPTRNFLDRPFWKIKATVASDAASGSTAPTLRIRTLARDVSEADVFSAEPVGAADNSPRTGSDRTYTLYFETSNHNPGFRVAMDLLNAPGLASTTADLRLSRLEIESESSTGAAPIVEHAGWTFDGGSDGWQFLTPSASDFTLPTGTSSGGALGIQPSAFADGQPTQQFGWWNGPEVGATTLQPDRLYWAEFTVRSTSSDPNIVPSFRMRLNELGFQSAALKQISSNFLGAGPSATPPTTTPRIYRVFFPPNTANGRAMFPSFDLLTVQAEGDSTAVGLFLEEVRIFSVTTSAFD